MRLPTDLTLVYAVLIAVACTDRATSGPSDVGTRLPPVLISTEAIELHGGSESITRVRDLIVDGKGNVWVLNDTDPFFVSFRPDGAPLQEWGRVGGGPREFRDPVALVRGDDPDEVWVYDRVRRGLFLVSSGPEGIRHVLLPPDSLPQLSFDDLGIGGNRPWLTRANGAFAMARTRLPLSVDPVPLAHWSAEVFMIDPRSGTMIVALSIADLLGDPTALGLAPRVLMPNPLWNTCEDGSYALYDPARHKVRRIVSGSSTEPIRVPTGEKVEVTLERIFGAIWVQQRESKRPEFRKDSAAMYHDFLRESKELEGQLAAHFPEYISLQCAGEHMYWLQRMHVTGGQMGRGPKWVVVASTGAAREVQFPERFRPYRFHGNRVWGVVLDEWNLPSIASVATPSPH